MKSAVMHSPSHLDAAGTANALPGQALAVLYRSDGVGGKHWRTAFIGKTQARFQPFNAGLLPAATESKTGYWVTLLVVALAEAQRLLDLPSPGPGGQRFAPPAPSVCTSPGAAR